MSKPAKGRQRGGRRKPPAAKRAAHFYLPPETIAKVHIISEHDEVLIGDVISTLVNGRWQQIKRSRKLIRPSNRTQQAIRRWAESDVIYPDGLPLLDLISELEGTDTITLMREKTRALMQKARARIPNIRLAKMLGVPRRMPQVNDPPPENPYE